MPNRKPYSIIPVNDKKRLEKLYDYEILGTHAEKEFDIIAQLAADIFDCPAAFISFVGRDTVFYKSNVSSLPQNEIDRHDSLCSLAILQNEVTMIEDASQYDDLMQSPYINNSGGIKFYAGAPLTTVEGYKMGTICVVDDKPRVASDKQLNILADLSKLIMDKLENRVASKKVVAIQTEYMNRSVHDMKNYIGNLILATEMLEAEDMSEQSRALPEIITRNAHLLADRMNQMLNLSKIESNAYSLFIEPCHISDILDEVTSNYSTMSKNKGQLVIKKYAAGMIIQADSKAVAEIFENLFNNAVKYSFAGSTITITSKEDHNNIIFGFHDTGQGLTAEDMPKLFARYAKLSAVPTGKETSTGIGLTITKILVELHEGKIWAESRGKDKGTSFFVSFPMNLQIAVNVIN